MKKTLVLVLFFLLVMGPASFALSGTAEFDRPGGSGGHGGGYNPPPPPNHGGEHGGSGGHGGGYNPPPPPNHGGGNYGYDSEDMRRAHSMANRGDYYGARDLFRSLARNGNSESIRREGAYFIGFCSVKIGDRWQAISDYRDFLFQYDSSYNTRYIPDSLYVLGRTYEDVGNISEARDYYRRCINRFSGSEFASKSRERLRIIGGYHDSYSIQSVRNSDSAEVDKIAEKKPVSKSDPFEGLKTDSDQISRVNMFIQAVEKLEGTEEALKNLTDSDRNFDSVQGYMKVLSEKSKFEDLHQNPPVK